MDQGAAVSIDLKTPGIGPGILGGPIGLAAVSLATIPLKTRFTRA